MCPVQNTNHYWHIMLPSLCTCLLPIYLCDDWAWENYYMFGLYVTPISKNNYSYRDLLCICACGGCSIPYLEELFTLLYAKVGMKFSFHLFHLQRPGVLWPLPPCRGCTLTSAWNLAFPSFPCRGSPLTSTVCMERTTSMPRSYSMNCKTMDPWRPSSLWV